LIGVIEFALEKFPIELVAESGRKFRIRAVEPGDEQAFQEFMLAVPEDERLFIKHRVSERALFHEWCNEQDFQSNLPVLAFDGTQVVADATLHQRQGGWKRHIGLVSVLTHPSYRGLGLVTLLVNELVEIAKHCGLTRLEAEFNGKCPAGIHVFQEAGFEELVRIPNHVQDMHADYQDYVLMGMSLVAPEEFLGVGD
jgi:GNAT superfamily N-acetyltransferase